MPPSVRLDKSRLYSPAMNRLRSAGIESVLLVLEPGVEARHYLQLTIGFVP